MSAKRGDLQEAYINARLSGLEPLAAARKAGFKHPEVESCRVERRPKVAARLGRAVEVRVQAETVAIQQLAEKLTDYDIMPLEERRDFLTRVARGEVTEERATKDGVATVAAPVSARIAAVVDLNKQDGVYAKADEANAVQKVLDRLRDGLPRDVFVQCLRVLASSQAEVHAASQVVDV